ncbi:hypothetical protein EDC96DRAFT_503794 [Choanephora cucurbitarum]|nr:hypothetical protein EDC96DRAFT_503794 [Choanephora cucurbitarum]
MSMSAECKAYEKFASTYADDPFPITKTKMIRYIKFRARCSTFPQYLSNLEHHPLHGPQWLQQMNNDPDIRRLMELTINLWPREAKDCSRSLIGIRSKPEIPLSSSSPTPVPVVNPYPQVRVIQGPNAKKGFMVTDTVPDAQPSTNRIQIDLTGSPQPQPQPQQAPLPPSMAKRASAHFEQISRYRPMTPPKKETQIKKTRKRSRAEEKKWLSKMKQPTILIERLASPMQQVVVVIPREVRDALSLKHTFINRIASPNTSPLPSCAIKHT